MRFKVTPVKEVAICDVYLTEATPSLLMYTSYSANFSLWPLDWLKTDLRLYVSP
jgi:hypothetical protein